MKVIVETEERKFKPVTVQITFESLSEIAVMLAASILTKRN